MIHSFSFLLFSIAWYIQILLELVKAKFELLPFNWRKILTISFQLEKNLNSFLSIGEKFELPFNLRETDGGIFSGKFPLTFSATSALSFSWSAFNCSSVTALFWFSSPSSSICCCLAVISFLNAVSWRGGGGRGNKVRLS